VKALRHSGAMRARWSSARGLEGYYVRAFARDLGERLGIPAHLSGCGALAVVPEPTGSFAWPLSEPVPARSRRSSTPLPAFELTAEGERRARLGATLDAATSRCCPPRPPAQLRGSVRRRLVALGRLGPGSTGCAQLRAVSAP
jgi:hypothetical protein